MTTYKLKFDKKAKKIFDKLNPQVRSQFVGKLRKIVVNPHIEGSSLKGELSNCYKIKLRSSGYRLIYKAVDEEIVILVLAIGKRDKNQAYIEAEKALKRTD